MTGHAVSHDAPVSWLGVQIGACGFCRLYGHRQEQYERGTGKKSLAPTLSIAATFSLWFRTGCPCFWPIAVRVLYCLRTVALHGDAGSPTSSGEQAGQSARRLASHAYEVDIAFWLQLCDNTPCL